MAVLLATGMIAAAGCGDDDDDSGDGGGTNSSAPAATTESAPEESSGGGETTKVSLTEFKIDPANPSLEAGKATFEVVNDGQIPHALEIEGNGEEVVSKTLSSTGDTDTVSIDLKAGEYEWYCPIGNHKDQGMEGTLTVK